MQTISKFSYLNKSLNIPGSTFFTSYHLMQVGLLGEKLQLYTEQGSSQIQWGNFSSPQNPLTWYKVLMLNYFTYHNAKSLGKC